MQGLEILIVSPRASKNQANGLVHFGPVLNKTDLALLSRAHHPIYRDVFRTVVSGWAKFVAVYYWLANPSLCKSCRARPGMG